MVEGHCVAFEDMSWTIMLTADTLASQLPRCTDHAVTVVLIIPGSHGGSGYMVMTL